MLSDVVAPPSQDTINVAWCITFALAAVTLGVLLKVLPRTTGLFIGKDQRTSTSKVQVVIWTFAVLFALWSLFYAWLLPQVGELTGWAWAEKLAIPLGRAFEENFLDEGLDETYLLLLGFPAGAAIAAKIITQSKVESGEVTKSPPIASNAVATGTVAVLEEVPSEPSPAPATPEATTGTRLRELVSDDEGATDVGDYQYVLFTMLAVAYFLAQFVAHPGEGLPDMPDTLVGLTGVAAAAYVGKKGVYRNPPQVFSVLPPEGRSPDRVVVYGVQLGAPQLLAAGAVDRSQLAFPMVLFGTTPGKVIDIQGNANDGVTKVTVEVPTVLTPGPTTVKVVRPPGAESTALPFHVRAP